LKNNGQVKAEFYDDKHNLLYTYNPLSVEGVQSLPAPVSNVSTVALKSDSGVYVHEWNVFETPTTPPSPTTISWIQGGDRIVTFDWISSGAKAYNVKRSPSSGGPYSLIASNIVGTTYTDTKVDNGTTYYYVVAAANEAGESAHSPEKSIKPEATRFTGGLLDGIEIDIGPNINKSEKKAKAITDNNLSTREYVGDKQLAWHKFDKPEDITSIVTKTNGKVKIEFYDANYNLLQTYVPLDNDGIQTLPSPVKNVSIVILKSDAGTYIHEWNVFKKPSTSPTATTISWIYGGDKVVKLEWVSTGAKSYNVKRAPSSGGPYAPLASNIVGTSYTDKSVTNGTTYYYVVSAVNEAGESVNSPEKSIQPNATKYTGGLLDARVLNLGPTIGNKVSQTKELTDNNSSTRTYIDNRAFAWYKFISPKEITSLIVNTKGEVTIELYDDKDNLLLSYKATKNDQVEMLPQVVKGVKTVALKAPAGVYVHEWNLFGDNPEEPSEEPIRLNAVGGNKQVVLNWSSANGATGFQIKQSLTAGGPYNTVATVAGTTNSYSDTTVTNGMTYYYIVTAIYGPIEGVTSNEAFATPKAGGVNPPDPGPGPEPGDGHSGNRTLLSLTLNNGIQKEYDLSMAEVESFISWYEGRAAGNGSVMFAFDKHNNNKGPFKNRKDYVFFDKIITFEVNGYDVEGTPTGNKEPEHQKPENKQPEDQNSEDQYPAEEY